MFYSAPLKRFWGAAWHLIPTKKLHVGEHIIYKNHILIDDTAHTINVHVKMKTYTEAKGLSLCVTSRYG